MKIAILGYIGSRKSTTAKNMGEFFHIPVIYLDSVYWDAAGRKEIGKRKLDKVLQNPLKYFK